MKYGFFPWTVVCLVSLCAIAVAEGPKRRSVGPFDSFDSVVPANFSNDSGRIVLAGDSQDERTADTSLPKPLFNAAPPPEPESPAWGNYLNPMPRPVATPPIEYSVVGPPTCVLQEADKQDYRAIISDPDSLFGHDAHIGQAVNLFRPDGMAPIGVFGDHTLPAGSTFISYRYQQNSFDHLYSGSHRIGAAAGYPSSPTRMLQDSQVALVEYGATNDFTILAYLPFQHNDINSQSATGSTQQAFTNPGDIRIQGLLVVNRGEHSQSHVNFGLNLPVGFLEQLTVGNPNPVAVPYALRTSSGSYDLLAGYTYRKQTEFWTWGGQANAVIPTGLNTLNYEVGNQIQLTGWISRRWSDRWSTSARLDGHIMGNIRGSDVRLDPTLTPLNQTNAQGTRYINGLLGVNYLLTRPERRIREQRLFLESGVPLYQWVNGPQLGLSWTLNAGWGMTF